MTLTNRIYFTTVYRISCDNTQDPLALLFLAPFLSILICCYVDCCCCGLWERLKNEVQRKVQQQQLGHCSTGLVPHLSSFFRKQSCAVRRSLVYSLQRKIKFLFFNCLFLLIYSHFYFKHLFVSRCRVSAYCVGAERVVEKSRCIWCFSL